MIIYKNLGIGGSGQQESPSRIWGEGWEAGRCCHVAASEWRTLSDSRLERGGVVATSE